MRGPWASARQQMKLIWLVCSHFIYNFVFPASFEKYQRDLPIPGPRSHLASVAGAERQLAHLIAARTSCPQPSPVHWPPPSLLSTPSLLT